MKSRLNRRPVPLRGVFRIVLVTAPDRKIARKLAQAALKVRLVACANLLPGVESHYWWREKIERSSEVLILFKTPRKHLPALERLVLSLHPYDTPEFVTVSLEHGNRRYLQWLNRSTLGK
jgi:periplasmic divalent cation tolerance protein